jgi:hypothetical protein
MVLPLAHDSDDELKVLLGRISSICLSPEFLVLRRELEMLYAESDNGRSAIDAFKDALYAIIAENEDIALRADANE